MLPKKELYIATKATVGLKGFFRLRTINKFSGKVRIDTGWFPNKILDAGRNVMADDSTWMNYCQVGTDNTAPTAAQTALLGYHAGTSNITSTLDGQSGSAPYYGWKRKVYRFAAGTVAANLSEVGVGWATSGSTLISRALILDPVLQTPTTITPLIDELLEILYELRYYAPIADVNGPQVTLNGIVYDTITRASEVTSNAWSAGIGSAMGQLSTGINDWTAYDGVLGTVLQAPNGIVANCDNANQYNSAYVNNSYEIQMNCATGSTGWNLGAGIRSIRIKTTAGNYQTQFDSNPGGNRIPKTTSFTMLMSWTLAWAEL